MKGEKCKDILQNDVSRRYVELLHSRTISAELGVKIYRLADIKS